MITTTAVLLVDSLFTGPIVETVPDTATEYRKAPGAYDNQGDHCVN